MIKDLIRINEPSLDQKEIDAVISVINSGILTDKSGMGPKVIEFERNYSDYVEAKHAIAVSSGTAALHAALLAANIGPRDEVIVPSFSYAATAEAVLLTGAKPIFADIDENTYTISYETIENALSLRTRAIIPVDLYGLPVDLQPILEIAESRDIVVIEDSAQAHGAQYHDKPIGGISHMTCFSFYASKNMTTGEGGMITTNDDDLAECLRMIRTHGESKPYWVERLGHNYRMTEISAAIGIIQLQKLPEIIKKRCDNASLLTEKLEKTKRLILPREPEGRKHAWHLYTIRVKGANRGSRNKIIESLRSKRICAAVYYSTPIHLLPYYKRILGSQKETLQNTESASSQVVSLPTHQKLSTKDIDHITNTLRKSLTR
jgi:dTDP-4-amino-4,6-dideoxygalactose transaminase